MLKRVSAQIRRHDWFAVGIEIFVVVIGLMLAFQLDRWREGIAERQQEQTYVKRLVADVEIDIPAIEYAVALASLRLQLVDLLMDVAVDPARAGEQPVVFLGSVNQAAYTFTPALTSHTFENLRSTGDLRLIRDQSVKGALFAYYRFDELQRQYRPLQLDTEFHHFELAAGVLSHEQEAFIQENWRILTPDNLEAAKASRFDTENVLAAARRLQQRPKAVAWLPYLRGMQLEQIQVHGQRLERARVALERLKDYGEQLHAGD